MSAIASLLGGLAHLQILYQNWLMLRKGLDFGIFIWARSKANLPRIAQIVLSRHFGNPTKARLALEDLMEKTKQDAKFWSVWWLICFRQ